MKPIDAPSFLLRLRALAARPRFELPRDVIPPDFRRAAVLIAFWEEGSDVRVLLTQRASRMSRHAGEVSFPGGLLEDGESFEQAAVREAHEEVGVEAHQVELMGRLDEAWSGARNHLVPVVAWLTSAPNLSLNPQEVERAFTPLVSELLKEGAIHEEEVVNRGVRYVNPIVEMEGGRAYGLTADLLLEALAWGRGGSLERGPGRLAELESWLGSRA